MQTSAGFCDESIRIVKTTGEHFGFYFYGRKKGTSTDKFICKSDCNGLKEHERIEYKVAGATLESLVNHALKVHHIKLFIKKKESCLQSRKDS